MSIVTPPKITEEILLEIYNIVTLDDLRIHINDIKKNNNIVYYKNGKTYILSNNTFNEFIELGDSIENFIPFENINRIVQAWVWVNFNDLKTHSNSFCEFTIDIIKITLKKDIHNKPELNYFLTIIVLKYIIPARPNAHIVGVLQFTLHSFNRFVNRENILVFGAIKFC